MQKRFLFSVLSALAFGACLSLAACNDEQTECTQHVYENGHCSVCFKTMSRYFDADGTLLHEAVNDGSFKPQFNLPQDNEKWDYVSWEHSDVATYDFQAKREPKLSYFNGNVFQIITYDLENPKGAGSAFVFHPDGWFVTNAHVVENAYSATAFFNIPDATTGESYTRLSIDYGSYYNSDKDLYVGKIENYQRLQSYYRDIPLSVEHAVGETTYSVGYPNSSSFPQMNKGVEILENADILEKVNGGTSYIYSTSYIAPGSSGGVLLNADLKVLGITTCGITDENDKFLAGGSISAFNFQNLLVPSSALQSLEKRFHADESAYVKHFRQAQTDAADGTSTRVTFSDGTTGYTYTWSKESVSPSGQALTYTEKLTVCCDGYIEYESQYFWADGSKRTIQLFGSYADENIANLRYRFRYQWSDYTFYTIYCDEINYSSNADLTLKDCYVYDTSYGYKPSDDNLSYAKKQFNYAYEWLTSRFARYE